MTYPNGPYGQGFSGQPGYPQQPGFPQQPGWPQHQGWPQQPGYPGGYPLKPPGPSGATAIFAGILALPGGLVGLFYVVLSVFLMWSDHEFDPVSAVAGVAGAAVGLTLFVGAIALFRRKMIGRWLVVGGCAMAILFGIAALGETVIGFSGNPSREPAEIGMTILVGLVFPILTIVLAMLPSTARWIRAKQDVVAPPYYSPYPG